MRRFAQLFAGRTDCYGSYSAELEEEKGGKLTGRRKTVLKPLTPDLYDDHLAGTRRLGVVPIRPDSSVSWFAGDIDQYGINHQELERKCQALEIPVVACRTKSGGAHLYCFLRNGHAIPAALARKAMRGWLTRLGFPKATEVFPKQELYEPEGAGNWINLPYFDAKGNCTNYAFGASGERLTLEQFEQLAEARSVLPGELEGPAGEASDRPERVRGPLADAPPCVERMFAEGIPSNRNIGLTQIGIWLRMSGQATTPSDINEALLKANYEVCRDDPLKSDEIRGISRNAAKPKYQYLCEQPPACDLCDKDKCKTRKWGVGYNRGKEDAGATIDRIVKIKSDPPVFIVHIFGTTVKMDTETINSPGKFRNRVWEITGKRTMVLRAPQHEEMIDSVEWEYEEAPPEVSLLGRVEEAFKEWTETQLDKAKSVESVRNGSPFFDAERGQIIFRSFDFIQAMRKSRKLMEPEKDIWASLRELGAARDNVKIGGHQTKVWLYPVEEPWFNITEAGQF